MTGNGFTPGDWPRISERERERLVALARRRLGGYEHLADDAVSRTLMKWIRIPAHKKSVARIEQVLKTECWSILRSERRTRERETRAATDPSLTSRGEHHVEREMEFRLLRRALAETCERERIRLTVLDVEVFELICCGFNLAEIARSLDAPRHEVRRAQMTWRQVIKLTLSSDLPEVQPG